eukprot:CAMPEP_0172674294 /NCGR_PEP_ID=MMETSP1074-20121228/12658_1 /TAXON_ID=2916 /ORGANISM="Ceratium fusus, Strain PA161109" /LENGTH=102 /DNA_ID=CAMNT_0013491693 /DNA_START=1227 /DNA_END=1535 /DNA_ORIENTATION=+
MRLPASDPSALATFELLITEHVNTQVFVAPTLATFPRAGQFHGGRFLPSRSMEHVNHRTRLVFTVGRDAHKTSTASASVQELQLNKKAMRTTVVASAVGHGN